jgi:hypothetical protein
MESDSLVFESRDFRSRAIHYHAINSSLYVDPNHQAAGELKLTEREIYLVEPLIVVMRRSARPGNGLLYKSQTDHI